MYSPYAELYDIGETMLAILIAFDVVIFILGIAAYIFRSIALTRIGRRRGIKAPWLIWIPVADAWAIGSVADNYDASQGRRRSFRVTLLILLIILILSYVLLFAGMFSIAADMEMLDGFSADTAPSITRIMVFSYSVLFLIVISAMVYSALYFICIYKIFESLSPRRCVLHFILAMFIPLYQALCLFCLRNKGYPYPEEAPALPEPAEEAEKGWYEA